MVSAAGPNIRRARIERIAQRNIQVINAAVLDLNQKVRAGRNNFIREYLRPVDKEIMKWAVYNHGMRFYRDKTLEQFFNLINRQPVHWRIGVRVSSDDNNRLASVANEIYAYLQARASMHWDTGQHTGSLTMLVREVGSPIVAQVQYVRGPQLPKRSVITMGPRVAYSVPLESILQQWGSQYGIVYFTARHFRKKYGNEFIINFDFVRAQRMGVPGQGGTLPRLSIAYPGNLREKGMPVPGRKAALRRKRRQGR